MIKRRFYKQEHAEKNEASDSSSDSSDSEGEAEADAAEETELEDNAVTESNGLDKSCSTSSGYESEDSSTNEIDGESSGLLVNDDDNDDTDETRKTQTSAKANSGVAKIQSMIKAESYSVPDNVASCILKCKSTFKCRLCPRIVCLSEETLKAHLKSKRHARSEKLLKGGRLKLMLNSDGELDEEQETHAERHARIISLAQDNPKKKNKGRQRQRERLKRKRNSEDSSVGRGRQSGKNPASKRHKIGAE